MLRDSILISFGFTLTTYFRRPAALAPERELVLLSLELESPREISELDSYDLLSCLLEYKLFWEFILT